MLAQETLNLRTYSVPEVASHYAALDYLTPCEQFLFRTYLEPGLNVLDLGVGGGRTTPYLSKIASRYVGVDCSEEMIRVCRRKFPQLDFLLADASDLSEIQDASFDAIVFAFNGLDCIVPGEKRLQCLRECRRVLRTGGVLIFSSHNPRSIFFRPAWDPKRLRRFAERWVDPRSAVFPCFVAGLTVAKAAHSFLRAAVGSALKITRRIPRSAFWRGEGDLFDSAHGGMVIHCATPQGLVAELSGSGFRLVTYMGDDYPRVSRTLVTDWYYYVFLKIPDQPQGERSCA